MGKFFNVSECEEWYMYKFEDSADERDRSFFGSNEGLPMMKPESQGMLSGGSHILEIPCIDVNRSVPFFEEI